MKQQRTPSSSAAPWYLRTPVFVTLLVVVPLLAYSNSFKGAFVFDDLGHIQEDESIRHLGQLGPLLEKAGTRPLLNLSVAMNYAIGGLDVAGYHVFNVAVHLLAGLTLFGIVRRTLRLPRLQDTFAAVADPLALGVALLWMVHPLTTQAVTYVIQRCESMMSLSYLLMIYCVLRGATERHVRRWYSAALVMLLVGLGCKEVMVTAPFVVMVFDRVFLTTSWRDLLAQRKWFYAACWLTVLGFLFAMKSVLVASDSQKTMGFGQEDLGWIQYARSQPGVILHYFRLAFWPDRLCLDYEWPIATRASEIFPPLVILMVIAGVCLWAFKKFPALGFLLLAMFAILAPTSSIVPIKDLAFEHRMYLPLAALIAGAVCGGYWCLLKAKRSGWRLFGSATGWRFAGMMAILVVALSIRTWVRNEDYRSEEAMWSSVLAEYPTNARANHNLAMKLAREGRSDEAIAKLERAIEICHEVHRNDIDLQILLGELLTREGKFEAALSHLNSALQKLPAAPWSLVRRTRRQAECLLSLGTAYEFQEQFERAAECYSQAVELNPNSPQAQAMLGQASIRQGDLQRALTAWKKAVEMQPDWFEVHHDIARLQLSLGNVAEATLHLQVAQRLRPEDPEVRIELAQLSAIEASFETSSTRLAQPAVVEKSQGNQ